MHTVTYIIWALIQEGSRFFGGGGGGGGGW